MSTATSNQLTEQPPEVPLLAISLVGAATLLFEILLTRIFSVTMWYHFAFVAVSLALFGLAASGVAVTVAPRWFGRERVMHRLGACAAGFGLAIPASFVVDLHIPFVPFGSRADLVPYLLFFCKFLVLSLPFFFSGLTIAIAFTHFPIRINRVYFADLTGGGVGCALVVPVLLAYSGPSAVILSAALPFAAAALFFNHAGTKNAAGGAILAVLAAVGIAALNESEGLVQVRKVKSYVLSFGQEVEREKIYERWHPVSRVAVHPLHRSDSSQSWFYAMPGNTFFPRVLEVTNDAGARTHIYPRMPSEDYAALFRKDVSDLVYSVARQPRVLVVGVGGGKDILAGLHLGATRVTGVELNPLMIDVVQNVFGDFSGRPYDDARVQVVIDEGRNFIASHPDLYDVIKLSVTDTWASSAMGAYALSENYLYTKEAIRDFIQHLTPGGYLTITRWYPQETVRMAALLAESMRESGHRDPSARTFMARNEATMTLIAKNGEYTPEELSALVAATTHAGLTLVHAAGHPPSAPNFIPDTLHRRIIAARSLQEVAGEVPVNISPPTDDRPFFFNLVTFGQARQGNLGATSGFILQHGRALALLVGLLEISLVVVALFVLAPLLSLVRKKETPSAPVRARVGANLYFVALGLGYLLVEIPLLQRFILFLGHPLYAVTVVLFAMLVSSGVGSLLADSLYGRRWFRPRALTALAVLVLLAVSRFAPALLQSQIGLPLPMRIAITVAFVVPVGLVLGIPFPAGLRAIHGSAPGLVPWAWAVNGAASVAAPVIAMMVAILAGFSTALYLGAGAYAAAAALFGLLNPRAAPAPRSA